MKRKFLYWTAIVITFYLLYANFSSKNYNLNLSMLKGGEFTLSNIKKEECFFVLFTTHCGECETTLKKISVSKKKSKVYFIINENETDNLEGFLKTNNLQNLRNSILIDNNFNAQSFFNLGFEINYPTIIHYNTKTKQKEINCNINKLLGTN